MPNQCENDVYMSILVKENHRYLPSLPSSEEIRRWITQTWSLICKCIWLWVWITIFIYIYCIILSKCVLYSHSFFFSKQGNMPILGADRVCLKNVGVLFDATLGDTVGWNRRQNIALFQFQCLRPDLITLSFSTLQIRRLSILCVWFFFCFFVLWTGFTCVQ